MSNIIKKSGCFLLTGLMLCSVLAGCGKSDSKSGTNDTQTTLSAAEEYMPLSQEDNWDVVAQNAAYTLLFDKTRCAVRVKNNADGTVWDSNPTEEELSGVVSEAVQDSYRSQVILEYYDNREKSTLLESYKDAVQKEQMEVFSVDSGVRVVYTMGEIDKLVLPEVITSSTMAELESKLDAEAYERVLRFYDKIVLNELTEDLRQEYVKTYPLLSKEPLYLLRKVHENIQEELSEYFQGIGLTKDWVYAEYEKIGMSYTVEQDVLFEVTVDYTLTDEGLKAEMPVSAIKYDAAKFKLTTAMLLPYFGSAGDEDRGYMLIPDGSGALVDLATSSEKTTELPFYGTDFSTYDYSQNTDYGRSVVLPVYGMQKNGNSCLAVVESGAEVATLNCQSGSTVYPRDAVYPVFTLRSRLELTNMVAGTSSRVVYGDTSYNRSLTVLFHVMPEKDSGYVEMAAWLRERNFAGREAISSDAPFYLDTVGAVKREERFLSYKVVRSRALTTFEQAQDLLEKLYEKGVSNIQLRYHNWQGDSYEQTVGSSNTPASVLGGSSGLEKLQQSLRDGSQIYLTYDPLMRKQQSFRGLQSVLSVNGEILPLYGQLSSTELIYLNVANINKTFDKLKASLKKQNFSGVSLSSIGNTLYSDANDSRFCNRSEMADVLAEQMASLDEATKVMVDTGNSYTLPYADSVMNVPMSHSNRYVEKESVPFLQMVLHGYVSYTGEALNMSDNYETARLRSIEYGGEAFYIINYAAPSLLKNTEYSSKYSSYYSDWLDRIEKDWKSREQLSGLLQGKKMTGYFSPAEGVHVTVYENGVFTVVNYNDKPVTYQGITVPAIDFEWSQEGGQ